VRSLLYFTVTIKLRKMSIWFYGSSIIVLPGWLVQLLLRPFASWTTREGGKEMDILLIEGAGYSNNREGTVYSTHRRGRIFRS